MKLGDGASAQLSQCRDWLGHKPFALAQLDASYMGGIMNFIKVARLCEMQGVSIATHAWSATPGVAANLHAPSPRETQRCAKWRPTIPQGMN